MSIMADVVLLLQLSVMEQRCRSVVTEKNGLEEKLAEAEKAKKGSDKKIQQVGGGWRKRGLDNIVTVWERVRAVLCNSDSEPLGKGSYS